MTDGFSVVMLGLSYFGHHLLQKMVIAFSLYGSASWDLYIMRHKKVTRAMVSKIYAGDAACSSYLLTCGPVKSEAKFGSLKFMFRG